MGEGLGVSTQGGHGALGTRGATDGLCLARGKCGGGGTGGGSSEDGWDGSRRKAGETKSSGKRSVHLTYLFK